MFALAAALVLTAGMVACEDDEDDNGTGPDEDLEFSATLSGASEVPAVTTNGTGTATFTLNEAETSADWNINVSGLTSAITNAHIHQGRAGVAPSGNVIVQLPGWPTTGNSGNWGGTITSSTVLALGLSWPSLVDLIRNGDVYVNVHTVNNGPGEVRGQLVAVP
jgi:hypothetical protein